MKTALRYPSISSWLVVLALAGSFAAAPALADKPAWAGNKGGKGRVERVEYFGDQHRSAVHEYYGGQFKAGRCPPGLAKKHNGCMPPGQAKKWAIGRPLPRDVIFYEVPQPLLTRLPPPLAGHRYVRVAGDILMIAIGTAIVADAIEDIGR